MSMNQLRYAACFLLVILFVAPTCGQSIPKTNQRGVLRLIEKYKAPPYPASTYVQKETYDYRRASGAPVPLTLTDTFICDIWQRMTLDLKLEGITENRVEAEQVRQALDVYLNKNWNDIAGYRPWTHWNFVRKLGAPQRRELVKEVVHYMSVNGVRDVAEKKKKSQR